MTIPSTVQQIIDRGFAKSAAARPDSMMAPAELVDRIGQYLQDLFQIIAQENPTIIGDVATVGFDGTGWPRPVTCVRAIKVTALPTTVADPAIDPGDEINVVGFNDPRFCEGLPSLMEYGQRFIPVGQTMDPSGGDLTVWFARSPVMPADVGDTIDLLFPSMFDDLLQLDIAEYLAVKDKRQEDETAFGGLKQKGELSLVLWSRAQTYSLQQRYPLVNPPLTNDAGGRQQPGKVG